VVRCISTETPPSELRHVYLEGAKGLRDDLPG
jgi:chorismate mutase